MTTDYIRTKAGAIYTYICTVKGELKWKTSDSRTGMMIVAMYASSDKLLDLGRF